MKEKAQTAAEPAWLDPLNDRKTPYTDAELDRLTDDHIAMMADSKRKPVPTMLRRACADGW